VSDIFTHINLILFRYVLGICKVNEIMIISFEMLIHCCTVYFQVDISVAACCIGHSVAQKFLSRRTDHISNFLYLQRE
jgi:hypothetical protein